MTSPLVPDRYPGFESLIVNDLGTPFNGVSPQTLTFQLPSEGSWFGDVWAFHGNSAQSVWAFGSLVWWRTVIAGTPLVGSSFPNPVAPAFGPGRTLTVAPPTVDGAVTISLAFEGGGTTVTKITARLYRLRLEREFNY